jgi:HAD superfamily hydrolase (TIGR01484 family)
VRPIAELGTGIARSIEGVVFDVDDTLTRGGVVEEAAYAALFRLAAAGLRRIAVTGRPLGWAEVIATTWPVDLAVGENGAGWCWREGRLVREGTFGGGDRAMLDRVRAAVRARMPGVREALDASLRRHDVAFDVGEAARLGEGEIARLRAIIEGEGARCVVSTVHAHAMPGVWDKAEGTVRAAGEVLSVDRERLRSRFLFVGDSGNDAPAFAFFQHAAGVANVREHLGSLGRPPAWIASRDRGAGFAEIVAALLERRSA